MADLLIPIDDAVDSRCASCGTPIAPHRGDVVTTPVADGVVRDTRVHRRADCLSPLREEAVGGQG